MRVKIWVIYSFATTTFFRFTPATVSVNKQISGKAFYKNTFPLICLYYMSHSVILHPKTPYWLHCQLILLIDN